MYYKNRLKIFAPVFLFAFIIVLFFGQTPATANLLPGSKEDPLVTKSYVDKYITQKLNSLETSANSLSQKIKELAQRVEELRNKINPIIKLTLNSKTAYIGEQQKTIDVAPFAVDGRTMVPFRFIGEALGVQIGWEASTRTVSYVLGDKKIEMAIGSTVVKINGTQQSVDVPAMLKDNRTFVPVRAVCELLGAEVIWDEKAKSVTIIP